MTELALDYQLSSVYDAALGGLLVTTFLNNNTNTLATDWGGDGWAPGSGYGLYYGFPGFNPGNAYAVIFVNTTNPLATIELEPISWLAFDAEADLDLYVTDSAHETVCFGNSPSGTGGEVLADLRCEAPVPHRRIEMRRSVPGTRSAPHQLWERCCEARGRWTRPKRPRRTGSAASRRGLAGRLRIVSAESPARAGLPVFLSGMEVPERASSGGRGVRPEQSAGGLESPRRSCDARPPRTFWTDVTPPALHASASERRDSSE